MSVITLILNYKYTEYYYVVELCNEARNTIAYRNVFLNYTQNVTLSYLVVFN